MFLSILIILFVLLLQFLPPKINFPLSIPNIPNIPNQISQTNPSFSSSHITFHYYDPYAQTLTLKSSFDQWKLQYPFSKMTNHQGKNWNGFWILKLPIKYPQFQLKKGKYLYKLIIDGFFSFDPHNPNRQNDGMGNFISFFLVQNDLFDYEPSSNPTPIKGKPSHYRFIFKSFKTKNVNLVGNFNQWNIHSLPLKKKQPGFWEIILKLNPGKYYYNFIVDQQWVKDPLNQSPITHSVLGKIYSYFQVLPIPNPPKN